MSEHRYFVDTPKRKLFYHAHISPHLTYAPTVWDGYSDILLNKLNALHRRAANLMISDSSLTTDTKLRYLGLLPFKEKFMFNEAVFVFKEYRNLAPPYLNHLFICPTFTPHLDSQLCPNKCSSFASFKTQLHKWFRSRLLQLSLIHISEPTRPP